MVLTTICRDCAPLLRLLTVLPLVNEQVAPLGNPELHDSEMLSGYELPATGATVTVKLAGTPATTVVLGGPTATLKSVTAELLLAEAVTVLPGTESCALLPMVPLTVGVSLIVTVEVWFEFNVPRLQVTVEPTNPPQPAPAVETAAETNVAPLLTKSVNATPVVWSPLLVTV